MNSLSWFLYLVDVVTNIEILLAAGGGALLIVSMVCAIIGIIDKEDYDAAKFRKRAKTLLMIGLPMFVMTAFIPSQNTMYAIAASEIGERVAKSEQVKGIADDATKALQQWIKKQLEPEPKK